eukprot:7675072-Alexandrium_andersonii.AAC.1
MHGSRGHGGAAPLPLQEALQLREQIFEDLALALLPRVPRGKLGRGFGAVLLDDLHELYVHGPAWSFNRGAADG